MISPVHRNLCIKCDPVSKNIFRSLKEEEIDDGRLERKRRKGRNDYPVSVMC
jgi:hypothetical protein